MVSIYLELKLVLDTPIPSNSDPSLALEKITSHFGKLAEAGEEVKLSPHLQALIIMAKLPPTFDSLAQIMCQTDKIKDYDLEKVKRVVVVAWDQKNNGAGQAAHPQKNANAISGVQCSPRDTPFNQQQQYDSCGGRGGHRPRGRRGGQNKRGQQQQQQQQQGNQADSNVASSSRLPPPPPFPPSHFSFGEIALPATLPPPSSRYPTFNNTLELMRKLGICPSIETLKTLENIEGKGKERELEVRLDPRIRKHNLPRGKVQGQTSRAKRQRIVNPDEEVPLEWDEDAGALKWDEQDNVDNPMGLDIMAEDLCATEGMLESGIMVRGAKDLKHAQNTDNGLTVTKPSDLGSLVTKNISCCPLHDESSENEAIWMLDSGASWHFTYDTNDFVELEAITPLPIYTANRQTEITGKGTVIFTVDGDLSPFVKTSDPSPAYPASSPPQHSPHLHYRAIDAIPDRFPISSLSLPGSLSESPY